MYHLVMFKVLAELIVHSVRYVQKGDDLKVLRDSLLKKVLQKEVIKP